MNGGVPSKELNESSLNILGQPENDSNIQNITSLSGAEADPNIQNQAGKTLSYCLDLDKELSDILDQLARDINLLDHPNNIPYIISLLKKGANPKIQGKDGKTLSYYLDEKLFNILDELEQNIGVLSDQGYVKHIISLLEVGANPNVQNREDGKTLLHYVAECNYTGGVSFLLKVIKANPNVRDQGGKTPLHYAAKNNSLQAIELLLEANADPNVQDHSGKIPLDYVTEPNCLQALKCLGYDLDDSHENEGNSTTPGGSVDDCSNSSGDDSQVKSVKLSDCNAEKDQGYVSDGSCENEENLAKSPNNNNLTFTDQQTSSERPVVSDRDSEDSSDCDDGIDHYDTSCGTRHSHLRYDKNINIIRKKDSFSLAKIKLNKVEIEKYESIWEEIGKIHENLKVLGNYGSDDDYEKCDKKLDEVIRQALEQEIIFTFPYEDNKSFIDLIIDTLKKLYFSSDTTKIYEFVDKTKILKIVSEGATLNEFTQENHDDFVNIICKDEDILSQRDKNISRLNNLAHESIVNKSKQTHEYDFKAEIDNGYFCIEYPQDSIIEPVKILNKAEDLKDKALNLKVGILKIGESIVRVESIDGKRNYTDILGSIEMSFTTEVGEISIYLSPSKKDGNKIKVEIDEENKAKFNKLKDKSSLGENCLLEGESVAEVIGKDFESVPTETTKDVPSTDLTQVRLQQNREVALGG